MRIIFVDQFRDTVIQIWEELSFVYQYDYRFSAFQQDNIGVNDFPYSFALYAVYKMFIVRRHGQRGMSGVVGVVYRQDVNIAKSILLVNLN